MTAIPSWAEAQCDRCHEPIAWVRTPNISKGQPKEIAVNLDGDQHGSVHVQPKGDVLYGGECPRGVRIGLVAAGHVLYHPHAATCSEKGKVRRGT